MRNKQHVAIVHHVCPICAKQDDGDLLFHKRLGDLSHVHQQNIGWEVCDECEQAIEVQRAIMLIVVDEARSGPDRQDPSQWFRCGLVFGVTEDYIKRVFQPEAYVNGILKSRVAVLEVTAAEKLGFDISTYQEALKNM